MVELKARDVMSAELTVIPANDGISHAAELMAAFDVGLIPVVEEANPHRLCGVITDRDIAVRHVARCHSHNCSVRDHMTDVNLVTVSPDSHIHEVMARMCGDRVRRIPVVDDGKLVGIVTLADVVREVGSAEPFLVDHVLGTVSERIPLPVAAGRVSQQITLEAT